MKLNVNMDVEVTDEDIDDIMCSALEGGICYWCDQAEVVGGKYLGEYAHEQISRNGILLLHDAEDEEEIYELTKPKLLEGIKKVLKINKSLIENGRIDTCNVDADVADCIVQYAIFDRIVFG